MRSLTLLPILLTAVLAHGCAGETKSLEVTATAYTSSVRETDSKPYEGAWGDTLEPGTKSIAVSRDLIKLGLTRGQQVEIEGLPGKYEVLDKMHRRWRKKIDIYMGKDVERARQWGERKVVITWSVDP